MTARRFTAVVAMMLMIVGADGHAQEDSTNQVNVETDWSVFVEDDPTQCWIVSAPRETENTRDGQVVSVNRGEILLFVSFWPTEDRIGEVSFTGGYPFAQDSTVTLQIGDTNFELFTEGEMAWAANTEEDARLITAMRGGSEAVLVARSTRGTRTEDTFSLFGFTAAFEDAEARCSN